MAENRQSVQDGSQRFDMVQQPRRFACDRCRMQKLRCERDVWKPYLMPCKRCRKADVVCMITSTVNRSISKRSRQRVDPAVAAGTKARESQNGPEATGCASKFPEQKSEKSSSFVRSDLRNTTDQEVSTGPSSMQSMWIDPSNTSVKPDYMLDEDSYQQSLDLGSVNISLFSGLITPPSSDTEREPQMLYSGSNLPSHSEGWENLVDACGKIQNSGIHHVEYGTNIPCSTNIHADNQILEHDCCGRFFELNLRLMECQRIVSQELAVLPSSRPAISTANYNANYDSSTALDSAVRTVLRLSKQFIHLLTLSARTGVFQSPSQAFPASGTTKTAAPQMSNVAQEFNQDCPQHLASLPISFDDRGSCQMATIVPFRPQDARAAGYEPQSGPNDVGISTILVLINCYICLLGVYHAIFTRILQDLVTCVSPTDGHLTPTLPGSFPTFAVNTIDPSRELQLQALFSASMHMLVQIEARLGLPERQRIITTHGFEDGALSTSVAVTLLDALSSKGYGIYGNDPESGKRSLKETIEIITQFSKPV